MTPCRSIVLATLVACNQQTPRAGSTEQSRVLAEGRVSPSAVDSGDHRSLIGLAYPPIPPGYEIQSGLLLHAGGEFGLAYLVRGADHVLLLDSLTHRDSQGRPYWIILDVLSIPTLDPGEEVAQIDCFLADSADASIVAVGKWTDQGSHVEDLTQIRFAARPNTPLRRFELLPVDKVTCWYDADRR